MSELMTDYALQAHNTFGFKVHARYALRIENEAMLRAALVDPRIADLPRLVLGGGSNIVLTGDFDGIVWLISMKGRRLVHEDEQAWFVEAGAGENWHEFVAWTLEQGCPGLENLALIPGLVGAAPVQNIGAYGLEIAEHFATLSAIELSTGKTVVFDKADCGFAYRDSFFKQQGRGRFVIASVTFRLPKKWRPRCDYADLARQFSVAGMTDAQPTPRDIFEAVVAIRRAKLPNPAEIGNVGSFFKNPAVSAEDFDLLLAREADIVAYRQPDRRVKLAAGWLIEQCGWKGRGLGPAAVHAQHALVLINKGGAQGQDILELAGAIQHDVDARFGVQLELEPTVI